MRKKLLGVSLIIILLSLAAYGTWAYFAGEARTTNVITTGTIDITLVETTTDAEGNQVEFPTTGISGVMPSATISKVVSVTNEAADAWVRIRLEERIVSREGGALPLVLGDGTPAYTLNFTDTDSWHHGADGHRYYTMPVGYRETTEVLFDGVTFSPKLGNDYQGCTVYIDVIAEAVQFANNPLPDSGRLEDIPGWPE